MLTRRALGTTLVLAAALLVGCDSSAEQPEQAKQTQHRAPGCADIGAQPSGPLPSEIVLRHGVPTRLAIGGGDFSFGINYSDEEAGTVYFTVILRKQTESFEVAQGDLVGFAGVCWRSVEVDPGHVVLRPSRPASPATSAGQ